MMKTLVIYDSAGYIIQTISGNYRIPQGIPYLEVEIPDGKRIKTINGIGVDVSVTPNVVILEDIPLTDAEVQAQRISDLEMAMAAVMGGSV